MTIVTSLCYHVPGVCILLVQEWFNCSNEAEDQRARPGPDPFKSGPVSPFRSLPSADPSCILVDSTHSFHIHGVGVNFGASLLVMACRKELFGRGGLDVRLGRAYGVHGPLS